MVGSIVQDTEVSIEKLTDFSPDFRLFFKMPFYLLCHTLSSVSLKPLQPSRSPNNSAVFCDSNRPIKWELSMYVKYLFMEYIAIKCFKLMSQSFMKNKFSRGSLKTLNQFWYCCFTIFWATILLIHFFKVTFFRLITFLHTKHLKGPLQIWVFVDIDGKFYRIKHMLDINWFLLKRYLHFSICHKREVEYFFHKTQDKRTDKTLSLV